MPASILEQPSPPEAAEVLVRLDHDQPLPPLARFEWTPSIVITLDRKVLTTGAVPAVFPGPLVSPLVERTLTSAGWARIVAAAREGGLLGGVAMFGVPNPGGDLLRLRLVADGRLFELTATNTADSCLSEPCHGAPGTHAALIGFVARLMDLESWLGTEVGAEAAHEPSGYAIVVGPVPDDQGLPQPPMDWPFDTGFGGFGKPFADGSGFRCGTLTGQDAATFRATLDKATQVTRWRGPVGGSLHGLTVKPLQPGDGDACEGLV